MSFGNRVQKLRDEKGWSQREFAELIDVNYNTYLGYEKNRTQPSFEVVNRIADKLDCSVDYLLGRVKDPQVEIIEGDDLPDELKAADIKRVLVLRDFINRARKKNLSAEEIKEVLDFALLLEAKKEK